jgi:hypothetical protein
MAGRKSYEGNRTITVLGLDIGTSHIVGARNFDQNFQYERQLNAFVGIPHTKMAEGLLKKESIPHAVQGEQILVFGNQAEQFAELFHVEARRPMMHGILNPAEADGLLVIRQIITRLLGRARKPGQTLYFSVPAPAFGVTDDKFTFHGTTFAGVSPRVGLRAKSISEGLAVVCASWAFNFTGIGISCGGACAVCLLPLGAGISFSVAKPATIDCNSASAIRDLATSVRVEKERGFRFNGFFENKVFHASACTTTT